MTEVNNITMHLQTAISKCNYDIISMLQHVTIERDKLITTLAQEQKILNSSSLAITVVNTDKTVMYANSIMTEYFQIVKGDTYNKVNSEDLITKICSEIIDSVFYKNKSIHKIVQNMNDVPYYVSAYPITTNIWTVFKVVLIIQLAEPILNTLKELGLCPPNIAND